MSRMTRFAFNPTLPAREFTARDTRTQWEAYMVRFVKGLLMSAAILAQLSTVLGAEDAPTSPKPGTSWAVDLKGLFEAPVALVDESGKDLVTRRAGGHPVVVDWNGDGLNDLLLGCHQSMNTSKPKSLRSRMWARRVSPGLIWRAQVP